MQIIEWLGTNFIGLFEAGAEQFVAFITGIISLLIVLLTFMNALISGIGEERVTKWVQKGSKHILFRYTLVPILAVMIMTNPMCYTFGRFVEEKYKPAIYDATVSFLHPVTGLFPYANAGELFVFLGIANGVTQAGYSQSPLATRYLIAGIIVVFLRGTITEQITKFLIKRKNSKTVIA